MRTGRRGLDSGHKTALAAWGKKGNAPHILPRPIQLHDGQLPVLLFSFPPHCRRTQECSPPSLYAGSELHDAVRLQWGAHVTKTVYTPP